MRRRVLPGGPTSGIERSTAREQLRVARALVALPALDHAVETGRLSYTKAKVVSRLAQPDTIAELIELSEPCSAGRLGILLAAWQQRHESAHSLAAANTTLVRCPGASNPTG